MVAEFEAAVFGAEVGVVTEPVESAFGFHVILVDERAGGCGRSRRCASRSSSSSARERVQAKIAGLVEFSGVRTFPERIPPLADDRRRPADADRRAPDRSGAAARRLRAPGASASNPPSVRS
jgi:hypothetical protein